MFKRRTPEAILLTVPYTGTHFTKALFATTGAYTGIWAKTYVPSAHWLDEDIAESWDKIIQTKLVITARDPYLSAIRCIKTKQDNPIAFIADAWSMCFKAMKKSNYFVFDIGCKKENRLEHALDAINFVGADLGSHNEPAVASYVDAWLPENESQSKYKTEYLETGNLPDEYDWSLLDEASEWYNALLTNTK